MFCRACAVVINVHVVYYCIVRVRPSLDWAWIISYHIAIIIK